MKATDLMIGDWVQFRGELCKLVCIPSMHRVTVACGIFQTETAFESLQPIPLTPEILEKNGFGYIEKDEGITHFYQGEPHYCRSMTLHIGTNNQGGYWLNTYSNTIFGLRFVHELQHALKLCGIDKEIVL